MFGYERPQGGPPNASFAPPGDFAVVAAALERLETLIDAENLVLSEHRAADLAQFNHRKSHALLELTRAMRGLDAARIEAPLQRKLADVRTKLKRNSDLLQMHMRAVGEISDVIARAMRDADSDGTYSTQRWGGAC